MTDASAAPHAVPGAGGGAPVPFAGKGTQEALAGLSAVQRRLLAATAGPLLPPVRSEIFGPQRFAQHGRSLGLTHEARRPAWADASFFPRLRANIDMLRLAHGAIAEQTTAGEAASPAAQWLLDNFSLIDAQLLAIHEGVPRSYFRELPVLSGEALTGLPRVYGVAWAFVAHTDSAFDEDLLVHYLDAYQETRELGLAELWALPTTLRVVLVENLRRLAERLATQQAARELANRCCDRIATCAPQALEALCKAVLARGVADAFLAQMGQRLLEHAHGAGEPVPPAVKLWLAARLPQPAALQAAQGAEQTADNLSVSNAVNALRAIGDADWPAIVGQASTLMHLMLGAPLFAAEHHRTRDVSLHGIERLARRAGCSEMAVARALLALMKGGADTHDTHDTHDAPASAPASAPAEAMAGHWLRGPGRAALAQAVGLHERGAAALRALRRHAVLPLYLGAVAAGTAALVAALLWPGANAPWPALAWPALLLMAWPASEAVIALLHRLLSESVPPQHVPRLALADGIPAEHRVMVVIPAMLIDSGAIDGLVHRLRLHQLANPEAHVQFALLTDWADADAARAESDAALLAQATERMTTLNARHGEHGALLQRFLLLHRRRSYSASEERWIGWERKRGKLEQLVAELAEGPGSAAAQPRAFVDLGALSAVAPGTRYIVTLDSDTQLPPGRLRELVGVAAHPANRPHLSPDGRRVVAGYGILQPRLVTPLPLPREDTLYHRLFAGQSGVDPYSAASSEMYQDLFDEGSYTGKGLLDVAAMHAVLGGHLPEGQVLSHDLLEGALARCAAVTDITLVEDAPFHAEVAASRVHRWTRGDWQLLPILLRSLVQPRHFPLGGVNRWKLADNLRRSLVAPMSLALLVLALAGGGMAPVAALLLVAAAFAAGPLMGALAGCVPQRDDVAWRHFASQAGRDIARALGGAAWHVAMLLQHALAALDAVARALWRMGFSQRRLLQWTTAAAAQAAATQRLGAALRLHWPVPALALALGVALWRLPTPHPVATALLCLLWGAAPLWSWAASRNGLLRQPQACPAEDLAYLRSVARDTWRSFERTVSAADLHLPPDNLQTRPHEMLAHRTSPTNIGLYLLSTACARQFGWIDTPEMLQRLEATLATLDALQRHRGHFLNWYDTETGAPLLPMYVSTVDSGNLSGHLLAVAQACIERAAQGPGSTASGTEAAPDAATAQRLRAVARHCQHLAWAPDFHFLYHPRRHLLHIGWRVAEQQLDASFYDLLASESRLTSLLAIAKGDLPVRHWATLGRPFYAVGTVAGLLSWSGSMFEYLMPTLILAEPHGSVLHEAGLAALAEQRDFAAAQGVPWGISESAYAGCDHTLAYQYAPQGVPRLALRRTPADELVVAPYATGLAAMLQPHRASLNYAALQGLGARGPLGFIEALDFTPARQTGGEALTAVHTVMAHHQGMTIVALANVLLEGAPQRWGMADPHIEAVASLLHERAPREVSRLREPAHSPPPQAQRRRTPTLLREVVPGRHAIEPTHLLSNGRYSVALRANGAGRSSLGALGITRWRDDALRDAHGHFFWLRRGDERAPVSLTQHPAPDPLASYRSTFHADRVAFEARWPTLRVHMTAWVSPEDDIEFRQMEIGHDGAEAIDIEVLSAFEPTLAEPRADEAHPAFGNLFLRARGHHAQRALLFERRPRLAGEQGLHMAHFLAESAPEVTGLRLQVDRQRWLGRNRAGWLPRAALDDFGAAGHDNDKDNGNGSAVEADGSTPLHTGLDPVCVLGVRLRLAPGARVRLTFATAAAGDAATLRSVIDKHHQASAIARASLMSATLAGIRLRALRMDADTCTTLQSLSTALLLTLTRPQPAAAAAQGFDRRLLWRFGLSGERPLVLVSAAAPSGLGLLRSLSQALSLWSWGGVACDLVVVNAEPTGYSMPLQRELATLRDRHDSDAAARTQQAPTGWHLLRAEDLTPEELATLQALARVRLRADGRSLAYQLDEWATLHETDPATQTDTGVAQATLAVAPHRSEEAPAPQGHFTGHPAHGEALVGDFTFEAGSALRPARPWANVLANAGFGSIATEAGGGTTWALNSRMNQLTPWSNDAVADAPSEWLLVQDRQSGQTWSVAPGAHGAPGARYRVQHGQGHTRIRHDHDELSITATWCVDADAAVKQVQLRVVNHAGRTRSLRLLGVCEWLMGAQRADRASVHTAVHQAAAQTGPKAQPWPLTTLLATQQEAGGGFGGGTAFLAWTPVTPDAAPPADAEPVSVDRRGRQAEREREREREQDRRHAERDGDIDWTCQRSELFDRAGHPVLPARLGRRQGSGLDPCAALALTLHLPAGASAERTLLLGWAEGPAQARALATRAAAVAPWERLRTGRARWDELLGATTVATPDPLFDALVNRWLLYQAVACRLWAKAGFYQAGGATGFRDQLQDSLALAWAAPQLLRAQLLRCAARQFVEGDVQHWWHAPQGAGVRTHFSDDLLWLPFAVAHYVARSGDAAVLDEVQPFIEGQVIPEGAEDAYGTPTVTTETATLYEHAARAIDRSLRVGSHGLPLMGSGDWNDGMNRVGHQGRGESVWLAWFLCRVVADFGPLARARGDSARAQRWDEAAQGWRAALQGPAWDGAWYLRAFFDSGRALGSHANAEARIDLIAQAWSVLSGAAPAERQAQAMAAAHAELVDEGAGLVRLLHPPLAQAEPSAGYIQAYPPGVRENGGQYSHAGVWALMAWAQLARALPEAAHAAAQPPAGVKAQAQAQEQAQEQAQTLAQTQAQAQARAWQYWLHLSPAHRAANAAQGAVYGTEPYAMAGDVYTAAPYTGRGGWSWYTGAAAWMHRAALESIFGLSIGPQDLSFTPALPAHWPRATLSLRRDGRSMQFLLLRASPEAALLAAGVWHAGAVSAEPWYAGALGAPVRLLLPGQALAWQGLAASTAFVVPLLMPG